MTKTIGTIRKQSILGLLVAVGLFSVPRAEALPEIGLQTWTCRNFSFQETVDFSVAHGIRRIELYGSHVDPNDPIEVNRKKLDELDKHGITAYSMYAGANGDSEEDRRLFELARLYGMEFIVVEPKDQKKWPQLLKLAAEIGIKLAVHNHGSGTTYGDPEKIRELLDKYPAHLLGVCLDVGWVTSAGFDAEEIFRSYGDRVLDVHFKDKRISSSLDGNNIKDTEPGKGQVNFAGLFDAIADMGWSGTMAIETDSDEFASDPGPLVELSKAFFDTRIMFQGWESSSVMGAIERTLPETFPLGLDRESVETITRQVESLEVKLRNIRNLGVEARNSSPDVEIFLKNVVWTLRYEAQIDSRMLELIYASLATGHQRADGLLGNHTPWLEEKGRILRGYRSRIDDSMQVFGLVVPENYKGETPVRLDVVLHGSIRKTGAAALRFANWFKQGAGRQKDEDQTYIEIFPIGRVTNGYRFAGQTDVFEVIEAVAQSYNIDRDRIVMRGFSMGASGTWHVGLKHPDKFAALGPYTGYVDTRRFSEGPNPRLIRIGKLPDYQEKMFSMLDAIGYVENAALVPAIGAIGSNDIGYMNHQFMAKAYADAGMQMINLVSQGTEHWLDPVTHQAQLDLIAHFAEDGVNRSPHELHFVTWTLKYNQCHWLELLGLEEHYSRAEIVASVVGNDSIEISQIENITAFAIRAPYVRGKASTISILGKRIPLPDWVERYGGESLIFIRDDRSWRCVDSRTYSELGGKRPGLQGPIDDAFTAPFLCVRGTGKPWNPEVADWAEASLKRFAYEWNRYMVGDVPIKEDIDVSSEDIRTKNLILFGDPGSNRLMREVLPKLPIEWDPEFVQFDGKRYPSESHAPILVNPNPLPDAEGRYVVLNSGHTFHEASLSSVAYLIYPRLGDWAIVQLGTKTSNWKPGSGMRLEEIERAGLFDESWKGIASQ